MIPEKTKSIMTLAELKELAKKLGDHNANWVEQALEWAQRISNGESWEVLCNDADTANACRLVVWKNGFARLVGGTRYFRNHAPASHVYYEIFSWDQSLIFTVPLVVRYK